MNAVPFSQYPKRIALLTCVLSAWPASADDSEAAKRLKAKGMEYTESKGRVTTANIPDGSKLNDEDFRDLTSLTQLKTLSMSKGLNDTRIAQLTTLANLEYLQTNLADLTDEGVKPLASLRILRNLKFFHPGKSFTGSGLAHLKDMPNLERLTVAGSLEFNDAGMAAVGKLTGLKEFRTWHAGGTNEGVKELKNLKSLKSLYLGQRLTYKAPSCPNDDTMAILIEMKSLDSLQLDEARLSFAGLQALKSLPALKNLKLGGVEIANSDLEQLRSALPKAKVEWTPPSEVYQKRIQALFGK